MPSQALRDAWLPHLYKQRIQVIEWRIDAELNRGEHERLVPELRDLAARHPLREHFHAQLMLALAQGGHRAEALAAYQHARRALVGELGIEPGLELLRLHERLLTGGTGPLIPSVSSRPPLVPRQLPAGVRHFVGRAGELETLSGLLAQQAETSGTAAIVGIAGIGKTALAVHWSHRHGDRFPDGQLYVNLRGSDSSGTPMPPAEALRRFLAALGVPARRIPLDPDERAALYRTRLAGAC